MNFNPEKLFELKDEEFKNFQAKLLPTIAKDKIIGIKTPELKKFAKEFFTEESAETFLKDLPHKFFEENSLHVMLINRITQVCKQPHLTDNYKCLIYANF